MSLHAQAQARAHAVLREAHLARVGSPSNITDTTQTATAQAKPIIMLNTNTKPLLQSIVPQHRSAAQRAAAQRFSRPSPAAVKKALVTPLIGCEAFYKHKQAAIKEYRTAYDTRVDAHFQTLELGQKVPSGGEASVSSSPAAALAHEIAGRHVQPITQFVAANSSGPTYRARRQEREAQLAAAASS